MNALRELPDTATLDDIEDRFWFLMKIERGLAEMSSAIAEHNWCHNDRYTLADIAVGCCLGWLAFRHPAIDWRGTHRNLARLYDRLSERAAFADTAPK